ncbi:envelope-like protein [Cucumis melo var. makuwa]|uniref:Envelope-like protein n=1 Tax=Cucumis melo var. makuwa TaxID=1194695 RepID=A0A5D3CTC2_CUCMM|nr:envelope-like protein [Cucumis melo var. makuwa]
MASNVQLGPSARSPPSSPLPFASIGAHESVPDDFTGDISAAPVGQPNDRQDEDEVEPQHPNICTEEVLTNDDDNPAVSPSSVEIFVASKLANRKFQQKKANVIDVDYSSSSPSTDVLTSILSGGTLSTWPVNGIPAVALSIKYAILHKIDIANWFPSSHAFSGSHVPDIDHDVHLSRGPRVFNTSDWDESVEGFFVDRELAARIVNDFIVESHALTNSINLSSEQQLEIDALIRHLKTFTPSTSRRESITD